MSEVSLLRKPNRENQIQEILGKLERPGNNAAKIAEQAQELQQSLGALEYKVYGLREELHNE